MFFTFSQNNSGSSFDFNKEAGLTHYVIIEADTADEAIDKAENIGIYFYGVASGIDCSCCGDRWDTPWDDEGEENPLIYGKTPSESIKKGRNWMEDGYNVCIHYLNGKKEWF